MHRRAVCAALAAGLSLGLPGAAQAVGPGAELEEVIVTATRRELSQQEVPVSVTALTGEQLEALKFFAFADMAMATPGLAMTNAPRDGAVVSVRGVGFSSYSSAPPAVDVYFNELPLNALFAFNSIFDLQQMELLRGPQGTLRGRPAPAGAIIMTTRRPELGAPGGHVSGSVSDAAGRNLEAAINVPVIVDRIALRVVGLWNESEGPGGKTIYGDEPGVDDRAVRLSTLFQATDDLSVLLTHQYMERDIERFGFVEGAGAGYNGPVLAGEDRRGVVEGMGVQEQQNTMTSLLANWDIGDNRLVYVGGYQDLQEGFSADLDGSNAITRYPQWQRVDTAIEVWSQELRLESAGERSWDYVLGLWYSDSQSRTHVLQPQALDGAFGAPAVPDGPANEDYVLAVNIDIPTDAENTAIFGHLDFHLGDALDLGIGARYLEEKAERSQTLRFGTALNAAGITPGTPFSESFPWAEGAPYFGFCPGALDVFAPTQDWVGENYPGYCDLRITIPAFIQSVDDEWQEWVYDASLAYHLGEATMLYLSAAHSWRPPGGTVGVTAPLPESVLFSSPEESAAFELGLKSELLDRRLRLNAALYYQEFDGFIARFDDIPYYNPDSGQVTQGGFTYNGDATVVGAEAELMWRVTEAWTAQLMLSASKGEFDDAAVPCRDTDFDGEPDDGANPETWNTEVAPDNVAFCHSDDAISNLPDWSATLQSAVVLPRDALELYLRGLLNYQPENDNFASGFERDAFAIMNLYAGVRSASGTWDLSLWTKNLFDDDTILDRYAEGVVSGFASGYHGVIVQTEREIGLSLRYAFGGG